MARYRIENLNYIVCGNTEKIINLDAERIKNNGTSYSGGIHENWSFLTDENIDMKNNFSESYNYHRLDKIPGENTTEGIIHALFDFKDVAIKSDFSNVSMNCIYGPLLSSDPIGFCQGIEANAYGMTNNSVKSSIINHTNLGDIREYRLSKNSNSLTWRYKLDEGDSSTFTYPSLSSLSSESYYSHILSFKTNLSGDAFEKLFVPAFNHEGIEKNYLYEFFMSNKKSNNSKYNDFINGDVFGNTFVTKNLYDAEYSMNLSSPNDISKAREYIGIGTVGGHVFLKYYDETGYSDKLSTAIDNAGTKDVETNIEYSTANSYQNVETIDSINRFVNKSNHKSNLYSVRLKNMNLESYPELSANLDKIKVDIQNSVRMISEKLAPAHTQLFKVYVDS